MHRFSMRRCSSVGLRAQNTTNTQQHRPWTYNRLGTIANLAGPHSRPTRQSSSQPAASAATRTAMGETGRRSKGTVAEARPSASVMVLSATNEVLVLQRVRSSTSFASAHVFPGGNLDAFHDGDVPAPQSPERHRDGPAYRLAAVRECFEETGILLARDGRGLIGLPAPERDAARARIHAGEVSFGEWLASIGGVADTGALEG